jgi:hypothetical protein
MRWSSEQPATTTIHVLPLPGFSATLQWMQLRLDHAGIDDGAHLSTLLWRLHGQGLLYWVAVRFAICIVFIVFVC